MCNRHSIGEEIVKLTHFESAAEFSDRINPFLLAKEAEHNLLLGLTSSLVNGEAYGDAPPYMAVLEDEMGGIHAVGLRTPPYNIILSTMQDTAWVDYFVMDLQAQYGSALPGVNGTTEISAAFAEKWTEITGNPHRIAMKQRIYRLDEVIPVPGVPGELGRFTLADRPLADQWLGGFSREILPDVTDARIRESVDRYMNGDPAIRGLVKWLVEGEAVSMAGYAGPTPNGIRIGAVYTPPELRRKGYASAVVAALSQYLLDQGKKFCFLYTDLSNPTSNHIYQEIGYQPICDTHEIKFE